MSRIRVLVVDDHDIVRYGIVSALRMSDRIDVVAQAATAVEALTEYERLRPDVVLMDISMPDLSGIEVCERIRHRFPETRVLFLTMHQSPEYVNQALKAGACGYLLKTAGVPEIVSAIEEAHAGNRVFSEPVEKLMAQQYARVAVQTGNREAIEPLRLTRRELEILRHIVDGDTSQRIADILHISPRTVEAHRANLMQKLGLKNTAALVKFAIASGLV
jgi:DNA-binding NarL/FixJ family response regulator